MFRNFFIYMIQGELSCPKMDSKSFGTFEKRTVSRATSRPTRQWHDLVLNIVVLLP